MSVRTNGPEATPGKYDPTEPRRYSYSRWSEIERLLPEFCIARHPQNNAPIGINAMTPGYFYMDSVTDVDGFNATLGVTPQQVSAMLNGALFGWDVDAADPRDPINGPAMVAAREAVLKRMRGAA